MKVLVGEVDFLYMPNQCMVLVAYHFQQYFFYISSKRIDKFQSKSVVEEVATLNIKDYFLFINSINDSLFFMEILDATSKHFYSGNNTL